MNDNIEQNETNSIKENNRSRKSTVEFACVLMAVSAFVSVYLTYAFFGNIALFHSQGFTILLLIFTLPIFILLFALDLFLTVPAFILSLTNAIQTRFKVPYIVIFFILSAILVTYPIVLFTLIFGFSKSSGGSTSSSSIEEISQAIKFLL